VSTFKPAQREQMRLRMALQGPAGSGKTLTAMRLARALSPDGSFAVIDTERRALEYAQLPGESRADRFDFGHVAPDVANPEDLPRMVAEAANERYGALIVDSFTHYWSGTGGALDTVDRATDKRRGWSEYRPTENKMMAALLTFPGHVIVTMRVKTDYVTEVDQRGRAQTRRVGLKPDQRDGVDYEFSVIGSLDTDHTLTFVKTTCPELADKSIRCPGDDLAVTLSSWLGQGAVVQDVNELRDRALESTTGVDELKAIGADARRRGLLGAVVIDGHGDAVTLDAFLRALIQDRRPVRLADAVTDAAAA
jgi:hypothetical protein